MNVANELLTTSVKGKPPFETIVAAHGATVLRVCRAVLGNDRADDAWSETFLSAMKAYPDLPAAANTEAWLVTIAHRKAIDATRARARRRAAGDELDAPTALPVKASSEEPSEALDLDLAAAVAQLPAKQKKAVAYHYLGGLPYRDVAAILGTTTDAARRAAADGIAALRRTYLGAMTRNGMAGNGEIQ